ncbi:MAG: hypothetical protein ABJN46_03325, partial [Marinobacter sp.]
MAIHDHQNGHKTERPTDHDLTVRHPGPRFTTLKSWAEQHGIIGIFEAIALTFGFTENFTIIGNLSRELSNSDSKATLDQWTENPYIFELQKLLAAYHQSTEITKAFAGVPQGVSRSNTKNTLRAAGADIKNEHFLLEMVVQPLALSGTPSIDRLRRTFRLWLIVQALERTVLHACYHDSQIQQVASALCLSGEDAKWQVIDELLGRASQACPSNHYSYQQFTLAIHYAATQCLARHSGPDSRKQNYLLKAILKVAEGQQNPADSKKSTLFFEPSFTGILPDINSNFALPESREVPQTLAYSEYDSSCADEDSLEQLLLFEVNPKETPEKQRLSGRSVLIQTAELSHYLPWSWDKPLPPETELLSQWLSATLSSEKPREQLGAALVWLALNFGRSLDFVLEFKITDKVQSEWSLSSDFSSAHRHPPRRHNSWHPRTADVCLVEQFHEPMRVTLPKNIQAILCSHRRKLPLETSSLHQLWTQSSSDNLTTWFTQSRPQMLSRLSSAKLANALSQHVFDAQGDHSLARLISAHPRAALPAACGYANWDIQQVQNGFPEPIQFTQEGDRRVNILGSMLAPLEPMLIEQIKKSTTKLLDSADNDIVAFHNNLVKYTVTALYAATGCRHLSEPFESLNHFCDQPAAVFINDKSDDGLHSGRMVPLAEGAATLLQTYCKHLRNLSDALAPNHQGLAERINHTLNGRSETLPLFFLLDHFGYWHPLNDETVPGDELFEWPLPHNLFRHRFAQQLARFHVDREVIDGWMGHGERAVTTYSDHSPRCWKDDAERYDQPLNACFDRLSFIVPPINIPHDEIKFQTRPNTILYREPTQFGQSKRRHERLKVRNQARSIAHQDLDFLIKTTSLGEDTELTQASVDDLVKRMLLRENGLPHPQAAIRMEVLIQWLESSNKHARQFIRHRVARPDTEHSLFRSSCPTALRVMPKLQQWVQDTKQSIRKDRLSKSNGLALAVVFLAIDKRISYLQLLEDLIQGRNYRVVQHKRSVYVEYNEELELDNFHQPVQRHQLDHTTARLLARGSGIKNTLDLKQFSCPKPLHSLVEILQTSQPENESPRTSMTLFELLTSLHSLVEQANLIDLPGIVAGALSERTPPTSVGILDHLRLTEGLRYKAPDQVAEEQLPQPDTLPNIPAMAATNYPGSFYDSAAAFFNSLHDILKQYDRSNARDIALLIERHCRLKAREVSSAVLLVGYWIAHRIRKGKGNRQRSHNPYAASSVKNYLSALAPSFRGLAFNIDLMIESEEGVTELCAQMLTLRVEEQKDRRYFVARLVEFFDWACERGVASPDWDELDLGSARRSVRPRLFSEEEYLQALKILLRPDSEDTTRGMESAFVLLLAYRFGLRANEAIGLLFSDWCQSGGLTWLLVQGNTVRTLKSPNSRRAVPLLFELSEIECSLAETMLTRFTTRSVGNPKKPILRDKKGALTPNAGLIPSDIAKVLRMVTGNPRMNLHQARHGFCNILSSALFPINTPLSENLSSRHDIEAIRHTVLGPHDVPTRRCAMAIARALGHQTPHTQFRSYNHLITEWADMLTPVNSRYISNIPNATQIHTWPTDSPVSEGGVSTIFSTTATLTPSLVLEALRLMSLGYNTDVIERLLRLQSGELADVDVLVDRINAGIRF